MVSNNGRIHCDNCGKFCKLVNNYDNQSKQQQKFIENNPSEYGQWYQCQKDKSECWDGSE